MLRSSIFLFSFCIFFIKTLSAANYCSSSLCPAGKPHIACGNNGAFTAKCPKNAKMVSLAPFKNKILDLHNSNRNLIASGRLAGYKAANRMATMQWDDELASLAALNVKQCAMAHDKCRNTQTFSKSGQNLAKTSYTGAQSSYSDATLVTNRVMAWWNEYKVCNMNIIQKFPKNYSGPDIGHFTVFVNERNIRLGCAAIRYTNGKKHSFLLGCNYATTNVLNQPSYVAGTAGAGCKSGRNPKYTSLCSEKEVYSGL